MKTRVLAAALGAAFATADAGSLHAEEELLTDRPDFTETSVVVAPKRIQLEGGFTYEEGDGYVLRTAPELLARVGVLPRAELRLGYDAAFGSAGGTSLDAGSVYAGSKIQLGPFGAHWGLAAIPAFTFSGSDVGIDDVSGDTAFELIFAWSRDLDDRWSLGGIAGPVWDEMDGEGEDVVVATVALGTSVNDRIGAFLEWAAEFASRSDGDDTHLAHHGYTLAMGPRAQLDLHGGVGLTDESPDWFLGAGFAVKWGGGE
jgi:hypothetical protein